MIGFCHPGNPCCYEELHSIESISKQHPGPLVLLEDPRNHDNDDVGDGDGDAGDGHPPPVALLSDHCNHRRHFKPEF